MYHDNLGVAWLAEQGIHMPDVVEGGQPGHLSLEFRVSSDEGDMPSFGETLESSLLKEWADMMREEEVEKPASKYDDMDF